MRVLFLIPSCQPTSSLTQLRLLGKELRRDGVECLAAVLSGPADLGDEVPAVAVGANRAFDIRPWGRLKEICRTFQPDVVHAWRRVGAAASALLSRTYNGPVVLSDAARGARPWWLPEALERRLARRIGRIAAWNGAEVDRLRKLGYDAAHWEVLPPAALVPDAIDASKGERLPGLAEDERYILCMGPAEERKQFHAAIWAFDVLKYIYDDLRLVIAGDGPDLPRLRRFAWRIGARERVVFSGPLADTAALYRGCSLVWIPGWESGGRNTALEAMATGRPIVACQAGEIGGLTVDGAGAILVPPKDTIAIARQSRMLLESPERTREIGGAGRAAVAARFTSREMVDNWKRVYRSAA